jgi:O-antigen/teichoic acid export membrane protein
MSYAYQAMLVIVGLWLTPFFLRRIGQHDYGLWLVGTQLLTYLTLTDFGVVALLPLETAYATGRTKDGTARTEELSQLIGQTTRLVLYQLPVVMIVAAAMWFTIPAEWLGLRGPLGVILLGFVVAFPLRILPALLHGLQDLTFTGSVQMVSWASSTAVTILMVMSGWSLYALAVGWLITQTASAPVYFFRMRRRFPGILPQRLPSLSWSATRAQLGKGFWINVAQVAQLLMSSTDLLIIGRLLGPAAVVPYSCTSKLPGVLANQAQLLMQSATPGLCEMKTGESRQRLFQVLVALTHGILTFSGLVFCVVLVVNHWFVNWWVTAHQYGGFPLTGIVLLNMVIRHWTSTTGYTVFCFGYQRRISLTNLADGLVTVATSAMLIMLWGAVGAPVGSIVGACLVSLPCNLLVIARDTDVTVAHLVSAMLRSWIWRFMLLAGGCWWLGLRWSPKNLPEAAGAAASIAALYVLVMLRDVLNSPLGDYIRPLFATFCGKCAALQVRFSS